MNFLIKKYYSYKYAVLIDKYANLINRKSISIGPGTKIDSFSVLKTNGPNGQLNIGKYCVFKSKSYITANNSLITLGDYVAIGHNSWIGGRGKIDIGMNSMVAMNSVVISSNHNFKNITVPYHLGEEIIGDISIGKSVWICANSVILPGVKIGDGSVISAGSVVRNDIPKDTLYNSSLDKLIPIDR